MNLYWNIVSKRDDQIIVFAAEFERAFKACNEDFVWAYRVPDKKFMMSKMPLINKVVIEEMDDGPVD